MIPIGYLFLVLTPSISASSHNAGPGTSRGRWVRGLRIIHETLATICSPRSIAVSFWLMVVYYIQVLALYYIVTICTYRIPSYVYYGYYYILYA